MGNGCTKRLNKNTVAPKHTPSTTPNHKSFIDNHRNHVTSTPKKRSTNPFEWDENDEQNTPSTSIAFRCKPAAKQSTLTTNTRKLSNRSIATENPSKYNENKSKTVKVNETIDTNSIIFDKCEPIVVRPKPPKPFIRSTSIDSDNSLQTDGRRQFSKNINRFFRSSQNLASTSNDRPENSVSIKKIYNRFSGSVQTLFQGNMSAIRKRNFSASDTNLTNLSVNKKMNGNCRLSQQELIDNDYCPSVLYNRKVRRSSNEKPADSSQIARWKNQLWTKFSRKKMDPSSRKS